MLFADLEGFTPFSEGRDPREVSEMLNAYLEVAIPPIVREHGGEIDRLIGDAIMATWGTRGDQPDHAAARRAGRGRPPARDRSASPTSTRTGRASASAVNSGEALVGILGVGERAQLHGDRRHRERRRAAGERGARRAAS